MSAYKRAERKTNTYSIDPTMPKGQDKIFPFALRITKAMLKRTAKFSIVKYWLKWYLFLAHENKKADSETKPALNYALNQETT